MRANGTFALSYGGLAAVDATGQILPAYMPLADSKTMLNLHVDTHGARYPITIAPWIQTAKLTASDAAEGYSLGSAVAIYGNIIAVGADGSNSWKGAVYTFLATGWLERYDRNEYPGGLRQCRGR